MYNELSMKAEIKDDRYMSINEVAKLLGVQMSTLRGWDRRGVLRAFQAMPHSPRKYLKSDVDRFLERQTR